MSKSKIFILHTVMWDSWITTSVTIPLLLYINKRYGLNTWTCLLSRLLYKVTQNRQGRIGKIWIYLNHKSLCTVKAERLAFETIVAVWTA